jgi:hypothetical protein
MCFGMSDVCLSSGATNFEALDCNYMWWIAIICGLNGFLVLSQLQPGTLFLKTLSIYYNK